MKVIPQTADSVRGFALLELFTSQGCSSCPPADRLLSKFRAQENVYALSFHVDYWNRLGWKDPFSNAEFSNRQSDYASSFGSGNIYTPQVVLNGEIEMVGSDEIKIDKAIKKLQQEKVPARIIVDSIKSGDRKISINFSLEGEINNSVMNVAVVQNSITTAIKAGENQGVHLTNYNVVREFKIVNPINAGKNNIAFDMIPGVPTKDLSLVLYLQNGATKKITAATKTELE